ncbi:DUF2357 domain-containing protein [Plasticicumulans lactativorans]|nr:DUF2357 domain-containing protein [Plasticicumulans lactativorans]
MIPLVLAMPWGLLAQTPIAGQPTRRPLHDGETVELDGRYGAMVALPERTDLQLGSRRWPVQVEGAAFAWFEGSFRLVSLPTAALTSERQIRFDLLTAGESVLSVGLVLRNHLLRPRGAGRDDPAADALHTFVLQVLDRIREAEPSGAGDDWDDLGTGWARLRTAWLERDAQIEEARRDLIVEHAEQLPAHITEIAIHPRRVLKRTRELLPIDRIQELDTACLEWLIRQPGVTVAEKAGPRQRLLGIAREEHLDTLENRVLKDFLRLSVEAASVWQRENRRFHNSERARLVGRYLALCRMHHRELCAAGIGDPMPPVAPNFVLQQDSRYRVIWRAYRELLSAEQRMDDLWRWQCRLWSDFARLVVVMGVQELCDKPSALSPLFVRREQASGRWSDTLGLLGVFLIDLNGRSYVAEVCDASQLPRNDTSRAKLASWQYALGCTALIRLIDLWSGHCASLCVWAMHSATAETLPLTELVASADEALSTAIRQEGLRNGEQLRARGLVIRSAPPGKTEYATQAGQVYGLTLAIGSEHIREALGECTLILQDSLERLFA